MKKTPGTQTASALMTRFQDYIQHFETDTHNLIGHRTFAKRRGSDFSLLILFLGNNLLLRAADPCFVVSRTISV